MTHIRRTSFGEVLSGSGGGCAAIATALLMLGTGFATGWQIMFVAFFGLVALVYLVLWAHRIEIVYDEERGTVRVSRRLWPFPATAEFELPRSEIVAFAIVEEDNGEGDTTNRYAFRMKDGSVRRVSQSGSNALGHDVVFEVNRMLGE